MLVRIHYTEKGITCWIPYVTTVLKANAPSIIAEIEARGGVVYKTEEV